jgi:hypothetical protein
LIRSALYCTIEIQLAIARWSSLLYTLAFIVALVATKAGKAKSPTHSFTGE